VERICSTTKYYRIYTTADQFGVSNAVWESPYIVISRANHIIAVEDSELEDFDEAADDIAQMKNEAKVLRAYALFDLARIYGKPYTQDGGASLGVPFSTELIDAEAKLPRSTVAENYAQVVKDLTEAISSGALAEDPTPGYINKWAAEALLTRVYLTMGDNAKALSTAEDVINNSPYKTWTQAQYVKAWDKSDAAHENEIMFEIAISGTSDWTDRNGIAYLYCENGGANGSGYGDLVASKVTMCSCRLMVVLRKLGTVPLACSSTNFQLLVELCNYKTFLCFASLKSFSAQPRQHSTQVTRTKLQSI